MSEINKKIKILVDGVCHKLCVRCQNYFNIDLFRKRVGSAISHCPICDKIACKEYRDNNKNRHKITQRKYNQSHKEENNLRRRNYRKNNLEKFRELGKTLYQRHKKKINEKTRKRLKDDPIFRLIHNMRKRARAAVKAAGTNKKMKTLEFLGCSLEQFKVYMQSKFKDGMNWNNHGRGDQKWHVDHILPCSSFDLTKIEEQKKCFHYTNLQPLWQPENFAKSDKILTLKP